MTFIALANDPTIEENKGDKKAQTEKETEIAETKIAEETPAKDEGFSKKSVVTSSAEVQIKENESDHSLSKFNYLFYFIYKHKYQDKVLIEQTLDEKL